MEENSERNLTDQTSHEDVSDLSEDTLQSRINTLLRHDSELNEIRNYIVETNLEKIDKEGSRILLRAALPSFMVLILSFFIDVSTVPFLGKIAASGAEYLFPGTQLLNIGVEPVQFWWLPVATYIIFVLCALLSNNSLKNEIRLKGASEGSISRIINRYSGIVDGIGTALPLLGAAILLVSIKEGPTIFLGFSVPFEIKAIVILAMAKLFDSIFEAQALRYLEIAEEVRKVETEYYYEQQETINRSIITELRDSNEKLIASSQFGQSEISKEDAEQIFKLVKLTSEVNYEFSKNVVSLKNAATDLSKLTMFDQELIKQVNDVTNSLSTVAEVVHKSTEYSGILKENMGAVGRIVTEINNVKLPEENVLQELQKASESLTGAMNSFKDTSAITNLDNLVSKTIPAVSEIVHKSAEYSNILKENMESVSRIVTEINNIKLPEEKILKELQITAHFISETIGNMKDTNAMKSLDNLVYIAGKR